MKYSQGWTRNSGWLESRRERRRVAFILAIAAAYILGSVAAVHFGVW